MMQQEEAVHCHFGRPCGSVAPWGEATADRGETFHPVPAALAVEVLAVSVAAVSAVVVQAEAGNPAFQKTSV